MQLTSITKDGNCIGILFAMLPLEHVLGSQISIDDYRQTSSPFHPLAFTTKRLTRPVLYSLQLHRRSSALPCFRIVPNVRL